MNTAVIKPAAGASGGPGQRAAPVHPVDEVLPAPKLVAYGAAKTGLIGFTRGLALELAPFQVNVNIVSPGPIETRGVQSLPAETREFSRQQIPMGFIGEPDDVANAVAFLVSEESRFITGQNLLVNGGRAFN